MSEQVQSMLQTFFIVHPIETDMFDPNEESLVLEIVRGFFDIPSEEMMKIGDQFKNLLFDPGASCEEDAAAKLKGALEDMTKEQIFLAGMFVSGLLRCNLVPQIQQQYMQEMQAKAEEETLPE
ncbi:MAG: hypothetical protein ACP5OU_00620 [Methanothrix sp.]